MNYEKHYKCLIILTKNSILSTHKKIKHLQFMYYIKLSVTQKTADI